MATFHQAHGEYRQAEKDLSRSIQILVRGVGADHPDTILAMNNLRAVYSAQGKTKQARRIADSFREHTRNER
jgi:hypothetical protein